MELAGAAPGEAELAELYADEAAREQGRGRDEAAAFWWTQALVMALVAGAGEIRLTAEHHLRAGRRID
ncbi:MAG: hypothetical protein ACLFU0_07235 [Alphaproteobacteria bacterium]